MNQSTTRSSVLIVWLVSLAAVLGANLLTHAQGITLNSKAAVLIDYHSGQVLYAHNEHEALPPASVTKVMTMLLALEAIRDGRASLDDLVVASDYAASMGGTQIWLEPGEQMPLGELLYAIAVGSANDAAVAVAEHLGGTEQAFVDMMNQRARELGMENTQFANPSGLPPQSVGKQGPHLTSAYDIAIMSRHAISLPRFLEYTSTWGPVVMRPDTLERPVLWTYNRMLRSYPGMDGIKTGMTSEAGYCLAATAVRDGLRLIAVTLGAPTSAARGRGYPALARLRFHPAQSGHRRQGGRSGRRCRRGQRRSYHRSPYRRRRPLRRDAPGVDEPTRDRDRSGETTRRPDQARRGLGPLGRSPRRRRGRTRPPVSPIAGGKGINLHDDRPLFPQHRPAFVERRRID